MKRLWAHNLSKGGMFIRTRDSFQLGTQLLVALDGAQEILPLAEGTVVWQRRSEEVREGGEPAGLGLAFTSLKPSVGVLLDTLVESGGVPGSVYPPRASVLRPEPETPVLLESPFGRAERAEPEWVRVSLPGFGPARLRVAPDGGVQIEFEDQAVDEVESSGNRVAVKFR